MSTQVLQLTEEDTVAVAMSELHTGDVVSVAGQSLRVLEDVPQGHKLALQNIAEGESVLKYGFSIGRATRSIPQGSWVHTHNLNTLLSGKIDYRYTPSVVRPSRPFPSDLPTKFEGYRRSNGAVGIRNEIWILNTVGCVNKTAEQLAQMANRELSAPGLDGFFHFSHPYGCSQLGDDLAYTQRILAALAKHPNAAGVLIIGLGCENNQIDGLQQLLGGQPDKFRYLAIQSVADEFAEGLALLRELADLAASAKREPISISELRIGLKCGGSDGFSGITANPLVGAISDLVVRGGGTTYLTEVPEMFGAETILMDRARDEETHNKIADLINGFKDYFLRHGQPVYENPSPGNKDGGITTLEEKSLGCTQKGGTSPVAGVLHYAEPGGDGGLFLVESPGNDMVSVTALIAAGAQMVLFTTGRGTPMGGVVPTVKISSNTDLAKRKPGWIDLDAGSLITGSSSLAELARDAYLYLLDVASGRAKTCNERNGFREIAIFKDGVTL